MSERNFTDADVEAIADKLMGKIVERAQMEAGKGLFGYLSKLFWGGIIALVAYGTSRYAGVGG